MKLQLILACCFLTATIFGSEKVMDKNVMQPESYKAPRYLYKILSSRYWQINQNRKVILLPAENAKFIRFSTEDQIEKTIEENWSKAKEVVILKIDRSGLEGKLVHETSLDGTDYYDLYDGFIPFSSIVESKIIYQEHSTSCNATKLDIVQVGDPVLRKPARELSRDEILSSEIKELIESMKTTMKVSGVGLAAPQIGKAIQLAVIEDLDHSHLTSEQLKERNRFPVPFHVIINPRIYIETEDKTSFFEGCLSVPCFIGIVPRAESVRVECLNEHAEPVTIYAKGWYARILQHEIDHLNGTLFIDRAYLPTLITDECYDKHWKGKSAQEIQDGLTFNNCCLK